MLLSKSCVYGLRASLYLASRKEGEFVSIKEMSDKLEISFHFLTKILQQLTAEAFMDFVVAIDGPELFTQCALGLPGCGSEKPCPLHESWIETRASIQSMLERTTLDKLGVEGRENHFRITANGAFSWN